MPSANSDRSDDSGREEGHVDSQDAGDESDVSYSKDSEGNADVDDSDDGSGSTCLKDSGRHVNADDVEDGSDDSHCRKYRSAVQIRRCRKLARNSQCRAGK